MEKETTYGVIGAGSFGTALANLLAENGNVLLYARNSKSIKIGESTREHKNQSLHERITLTNDIEHLSKECYLIFPAVPSDAFASMLADFKPYLTPAHILIHATKGLHIDKTLANNESLKREDIHTMSELIQQHTAVVRVGCLAGPNLASELAQKQPAATVIASPFNEVIKEGCKALKSNRFQVHESNELKGVELAGVLKNYVAIAAGILAGINLGENSKAMLITNGMAEMIEIAKQLGYSEKAFLGIAGIGDLIATCNSEKSRNNTVGRYLSEGLSIEEINQKMTEVAEGVKTIQILNALKDYDFNAPIAAILYKIIYEKMPIETAIKILMRFPTTIDAAYLENT